MNGKLEDPTAFSKKLNSPANIWGLTQYYTRITNRYLLATVLKTSSIIPIIIGAEPGFRATSSPLDTEILPNVVSTATSSTFSGHYPFATRYLFYK